MGLYLGAGPQFTRVIRSQSAFQSSIRATFLVHAEMRFCTSRASVSCEPESFFRFELVFRSAVRANLWTIHGLERFWGRVEQQHREH